MATTRRTRKAPSTTTRKSSETQTEKPQSDSKASEKASDETSTEESSSSPSSDDDALFEEADQKATREAEDDATEDEGQDDEDEAEEGAQDVAEGEVTTFEVDPGYGRPYTFKGVVNGNTIVVTEDAIQEFTLPGSKRLGQKMAHHKGQLLPLASYKSFIKGA